MNRRYGYLMICVKNTSSIIANRNPSVEKNILIASGFLFSIYSKIGRPKTRAAVIAAEITKSSSMNTGAKKVSGLFPKIFWTLEKKSPMTKT